jgi:hypothetical protein
MTPPTDLAAPQDVESFNATAARLGKRGWNEGHWAVDIRTSGPPQHIGSVRGDRLKKKIIYALEQLATKLDRERIIDTGKPHYRNKCGGLTMRDHCHHTDPCCRESYEIADIVYDGDNPNGKYVADAHMNIRMWWGEIYDSGHPGLRKLAVSSDKAPSSSLELMTYSSI